MHNLTVDFFFFLLGVCLTPIYMYLLSDKKQNKNTLTILMDTNFIARMPFKFHINQSLILIK